MESKVFTQLEQLMPLFRERLEAGQRVTFSPPRDQYASDDSPGD